MAPLVFGGQGETSKSGAGQSGEQALFQELPVVEAASLQVQTLEEAPANVTIISAADIRRYGYRTLGEALASVRGFDLTYDRIYHYAGVHGFSIPGDYNTRFLVMINGHAMTENVYSSNNYFGQDFGLDLDLVQRIEIIRGPSSALYGSNGIFATINVVTRSPVDVHRARMSSEFGSFGEKKTMVSSSTYLGKGANLLLSASMFHNGGQDFYFPEFDHPATNNGIASGVDGERGYHAFANLVWHDWDFTAYFNSREKRTPIAWSEYSIFNSKGNRVQDRRNFIRASNSRNVGASGKLRWTLSYDQYRYDDRFDYEAEEGLEDFRSIARGEWIGAQLNYSLPVGKVGHLTLGTATHIELRSLQRNFAVSPAYQEQLSVNYPDRVCAFFAQQEWNLAASWKAYLGLRYDGSHRVRDSLSPRLALVHQRSSKTVYKLVYGRPFRNPSAFELYFNDDGRSMQQSKDLLPETAHTVEFSVERKLGSELTGILNVYHYGLNDLIRAVFLPNDLQQFQNNASTRSTGVEGEVTGRPSRWLEITASMALQRAVDRQTGAWLDNSPRHIDKLRFAVPLLRERLFVSASARYLGARKTRVDGNVPSVFLGDFTATTNRLTPSFDLQFGIRNLFDRRYYDPIALAIDRMQQDGRSVFVKLIWRTSE